MTDGSLKKQIAELAALPFGALKERWMALFGPSIPYFTRSYMLPRLAYRIQELQHGGVSQWARDFLRDALARAGYDDRGVKLPKRLTDAPAPGTRLIREWNGQRHEVTAVAGGYDYQGRTYRSLSAIARDITGSRWSGPLFFGLRQSNRRAA